MVDVGGPQVVQLALTVDPGKADHISERIMASGRISKVRVEFGGVENLVDVVVYKNARQIVPTQGVVTGDGPTDFPVNEVVSPGDYVTIWLGNADSNSPHTVSVQVTVVADGSGKGLPPAPNFAPFPSEVDPFDTLQPTAATPRAPIMPTMLMPRMPPPPPPRNLVSALATPSRSSPFRVMESSPPVPPVQSPARRGALPLLILAGVLGASVVYAAWQYREGEVRDGLVEEVPIPVPALATGGVS